MEFVRQGIHLTGGIEAYFSFDGRMDIGRSGIVRLLQDDGSYALSQCTNLNCLI